MTIKPQPFKMRDKIRLPDLDPRFPDHTWVFWAAPNNQTFIDLFAPFEFVREKEKNKGKISAAVEEGYYNRYYTAIAETVLDTGESGIDLSSPDQVKATMESQKDTAIIGGIMATYAMRLMNRLNDEKKKEDKLSASINTGESKKQTADSSRRR